jgi:hypothetical protein
MVFTLREVPAYVMSEIVQLFNSSYVQYLPKHLVCQQVVPFLKC